MNANIFVIKKATPPAPPGDGYCCKSGGHDRAMMVQSHFYG